MCKVADAAMTMVNRSIDLEGQYNNPNYYTDFYKLHKLLYYAQGYMLSHYHLHLFEEPILAHNCGPFINELLDLPLSYEAITTRFPEDQIFPLTPNRVDAIDYALKHYGTKSRDELVNLSKSDFLYKKYHAQGQSEDKNVIACEDMEKAADIFDPQREKAE
jgi:uncharacterized phage-associated protein